MWGMFNIFINILLYQQTIVDYSIYVQTEGKLSYPQLNRPVKKKDNEEEEDKKSST